MALASGLAESGSQDVAWQASLRRQAVKLQYFPLYGMLSIACVDRRGTS